jgi:hypothetical protein
MATASAWWFVAVMRLVCVTSVGLGASPPGRGQISASRRSASSDRSISRASLDTQAEPSDWFTGSVYIDTVVPAACCLFSKHTTEADAVHGGERSSGLRIVYFLRAKPATLQFAAALSRAGHKSRGTVI